MIKNDEQHEMVFNPLNFPIIFSFPGRLAEPGAWVEHIPFAMLLIDLLRPAVLVELGTHSGNSYCAFCQAVMELNLATKCYAVDTWRGDPHAGQYGDEVLDDLRKHHDPRYEHFSRLVQSTFDDAVVEFPDGSIDLLHIDGLHTYEAVKHDFDTWLPKLSPRAVVLFHDINVREREFGVWKLWDELKERYPSFEFIHGHGLGIIAAGREYPAALDILIKSGDQASQQIRTLFHRLGVRLDHDMTLRRLLAQAQERDAFIENLTGQIHGLNDEIRERDRRIEGLWETIAEKDNVLREREGRIHSLKVEIETAKLEADHVAVEREQWKHEAVNYALSTSWRLTRPLRWIGKALRGAKNA